MKVLVCGGRHYSNKELLFEVLNNVEQDAEYNICILQGGYSGADNLAKEWAEFRGVPCLTMHAWWNHYGKSAGPKRNEWMLIYTRPTLVIAFPGGRGTAHMIKVATEKGVKVRIV